MKLILLKDSIEVTEGMKGLKIGIASLGLSLTIKALAINYPQTNSITYVLNDGKGFIGLSNSLRGINLDNLYCSKATTTVKEYEKLASNTCKAITDNYNKIKKQANLNSRDAIATDSIYRYSSENISKYYKPYATSENTKDFQKIKKGIESLKPNQKVEIIYYDNEQTYLNLKAKSYIALGYSTFFDRDLPEQAFEKRAREIGASIVVIEKQGVSENAMNSGEDPNNLDYIYHYKAVFLSKYNYNKLGESSGLEISEIPLDKRTLYQRNTGMYIKTIFQDGRAYNANMLVGDVIIKINNIDIKSDNDFYIAKESELKKGNTLEYTLLRLVNNELREIKIPITYNQ